VKIQIIEIIQISKYKQYPLIIIMDDLDDNYKPIDYYIDNEEIPINNLNQNNTITNLKGLFSPRYDYELFHSDQVNLVNNGHQSNTKRQTNYKINITSPPPNSLNNQSPNTTSRKKTKILDDIENQNYLEKAKKIAIAEKEDLKYKMAYKKLRANKQNISHYIYNSKTYQFEKKPDYKEIEDAFEELENSKFDSKFDSKLNDKFDKINKLNQKNVSWTKRFNKLNFNKNRILRSASKLTKNNKTKENIYGENEFIVLDKGKIF